MANNEDQKLFKKNQNLLKENDKLRDLMNYWMNQSKGFEKAYDNVYSRYLCSLEKQVVDTTVKCKKLEIMIGR